MKILISIILCFVLAVNVSYADQRMETVGGFCHFVVDPNNDDNEVFFANCENSIAVNNQTATSSTFKQVFYAGYDDVPISKTLKFKGVGSLSQKTDYQTINVTCESVDSNGNNYSTTDWESVYWYRNYIKRVYNIGGKNRFRKTNDIGGIMITYQLTCRNGAK
jgi:hypothetical protein